LYFLQTQSQNLTDKGCIDSRTGLVANSLLYSRIPTEVHNNVNFSTKVSQCKLVCKGIAK
jgi:hypothetical protein